MTDKDSQLNEIEQLALADDPSNLRGISDDPEPMIILPAEDFCPGGLYYEMRRENERLTLALRQISHGPKYDGRFCEDKEDCPNCVAQEVLSHKQSEERG